MEKFCFLCATSHMGTTTPVPDKPKEDPNPKAKRGKSVTLPKEPEPSYKLLFKYLLNPQDKDETILGHSLLYAISNQMENSEKNGGVLQVCSFCTKNANELRDLRVELETLQKKILAIIAIFKKRAVIAAMILGIDQPANSTPQPKLGALGAVSEDAMRLFHKFHSQVKREKYANFKALLPDTVHKVAHLVNDIKKQSKPPVTEEPQSDFDMDYSDTDDAASGSDSSDSDTTSNGDSEGDGMVLKEETDTDEEESNGAAPVAGPSGSSKINLLRKKQEEAHPSCSRYSFAPKKSEPQPGTSRSSLVVTPLPKGRIANGSGLGGVSSQSKAIKKPEKVKPLRMKKIMQASLLKCKQCRYTGSQLSVIENHLQNQHETEMKYYFCPSCNIKFTTEQLYWVHMRYHEQLAKCDVCNASVYIVDMQKHLKTHKERIFQCSGCSYAFGNFMKLLHHVQSTKHPNIELKCGFCSETRDAYPSKHRQLLYHHLAYEHNRKELIHECEKPTCGRVFFDKKSYNLHVKTGHMRMYCCNHCSSVFGAEARLQEHVKRVHDKIADIQCLICPKYFVYKHQVEHHSVVAHGFPKKKCDVLECNKEFTSTAALKSHIKKHGLKPKKMKKLTCPTCKKICVNRTQFRVHLATHSEIKGYACVSCGFETNSKKLMERHKRSHSDKTFYCTFCPKQFEDKKGLDEHLQIHTKERPFTCEKCFASFVLKNELDTHMKTHEAKSGSKEPSTSSAK